MVVPSLRLRGEGQGEGGRHHAFTPVPSSILVTSAALSKMPKRISRTINAGRKKFVPPSVPHEPWLIERLKDPEEAAAYLEAAIDDGDQGVLMLALRHIAQARERA